MPRRAVHSLLGHQRPQNDLMRCEPRVPSLRLTRFRRICCRGHWSILSWLELLPSVHRARAVVYVPLSLPGVCLLSFYSAPFPAVALLAVPSPVALALLAVFLRVVFLAAVVFPVVDLPAAVCLRSPLGIFLKGGGLFDRFERGLGHQHPVARAHSGHSNPRPATPSRGRCCGHSCRH